MNLQEAHFVDHILSKLEAGGYVKRKPSDLDLKIAIDSGIFLKFLKISQPDSLEILKKNNSSDLEYIIIENLKDQLDNRGVIDVLRNGLNVSDISIDCVFLNQFRH